LVVGLLALVAAGACRRELSEAGGSGQHQGADTATNLPVLYVGGGSGRLQVDQSIAFAPSQRLSNVYQTFLRAFDRGSLAFGDSNGSISALET